MTSKTMTEVKIGMDKARVWFDAFAAKADTLKATTIAPLERSALVRMVERLPGVSSIAEVALTTADVVFQAIDGARLLMDVLDGVVDNLVATAQGASKAFPADEITASIRTPLGAVLEEK